VKKQEISFNYISSNYAVGLLGGSFNPPHQGHLHISKVALKVFRLSEVYWIYTNQNPLKTIEPEKMKKRVEESINLVKDPRIKFSDIELTNNFNYSVETLKYLKRKNARTNFIWIMGEDNLLSFHLWKNWKWIAKNFKIGILARGHNRAAVNSSVFASRFKRFRLHADKARSLKSVKAPAWCIVNTKRENLSSSNLRSNG